MIFVIRFGRFVQWLELALAQRSRICPLNWPPKTQEQRFESLRETLGLDEMRLQRLECFDISHSSGEATVASCVVFDTNGPLKSDYRKFNIEGIAQSDYAAMEQGGWRRFTRLMKGEGKTSRYLGD